MDARALVKGGTGSDRLLDERPVERASRNRAALELPGVPALDGHPCPVGNEYAVEGQTLCLGERVELEPPEHGQRARIQCIAAQFVARKGGPVNQPHAHAGPRQYRRRDRACRPRPDNDDVVVHSRLTSGV